MSGGAGIAYHGPAVRRTGVERGLPTGRTSSSEAAEAAAAAMNDVGLNWAPRFVGRSPLERNSPRLSSCGPSSDSRCGPGDGKSWPSSDRGGDSRAQESRPSQFRRPRSGGGEELFRLARLRAEHLDGDLGQDLLGLYGCPGYRGRPRDDGAQGLHAALRGTVIRIRCPSRIFAISIMSASTIFASRSPTSRPRSFG